MRKTELRVWLEETSKKASARFGSYGEFVFEQVAKQRCSEVVPIRRNEFDFLLDGRSRIDVKSTASTLDQTSKNKKCAPYRGRRLPNIEYARVEFMDDGALISVEGQPWQVVPWETLEKDYESWDKQRGPRGYKRAKPAGRTKEPENSYAEIKAHIVAIAKEHGRKARVIYRTCQTRFGYNNPPDNLISDRSRYDLHIFVSFHDSTRRAENIEKIFAFPNEVTESLPRRKLDSLSKSGAKVDLNRVEHQFSFESLKEFQAQLQRVL